MGVECDRDNIRFNTNPKSLCYMQLVKKYGARTNPSYYFSVDKHS